MKTMMPYTLTFPSGIVTVQDAFDESKSYMVFPTKERNFTEYLQNMIDSGELSLKK